MDAKATGKLIYELRTKKQLTQKQLGQQINVTDKAISKWETGEGCPDVSVIPNLAAALGVTADIIISGVLPEENEFTGKTPVRKIRIYDFSRPDTFGKEELRKIFALSNDLARIIAEQISSTLNIGAQVHVASIDNLRNTEFLRSIPRTFLYDFDYNNDGICIEIDPELGKTLLKQDIKVYPKFTKFDLDSLYTFYVKDFADSLFNLIDDRLKTNNANAQSIAKTFTQATSEYFSLGQKDFQMCVLATLNCQLENGVSGMINIQFADTFFLSKLMENFFFESGQEKPQQLDDIKDNKFSPNIYAEIGRFKPDNLEIKENAIFLLNTRYRDLLQINVVYKNQVIAKAETCVVDENFGVRIIERINPPKIIYNEEDYISIQLGCCSQPEKQVEKIGQGTILELNTISRNQVSIIRNGKTIAKGRIEISGDYFAVKISESW